MKFIVKNCVTYVWCQKNVCLQNKARICVCSVLTNCSTKELYIVDNFPWSKIVQQCSIVGK
jgi:hypothetical protein